MNEYDFEWFQGVVEDIFDPEGLGRVRVRIFGLHTEDKSMLPTENLPWASPIMPLTSASINGVGTSPTGVINGSWVIGFFRDGEWAQDPIVWGTVPGKPAAAASTDGTGFSDPDEIYPAPDGTVYGGSEVEESDLNRLVTTNKSSDTIHQLKSDSTLGNEPKSDVGTSYPNNHAVSTRSGHHIEYDDTAGSERIHTYHRSGSSVEYQPTGDIIQRTVGTSYDVVHGDLNMHVGGNCNYIVEGNLNIVVGDKIEYSIEGTFEVLGGDTVTIIGPKIDLNP